MLVQLALFLGFGASLFFLLALALGQDSLRFGVVVGGPSGFGGHAAMAWIGVGRMTMDGWDCGESAGCKAAAVDKLDADGIAARK